MLDSLQRKTSQTLLLFLFILFVLPVSAYAITIEDRTDERDHVIVNDVDDDLMVTGGDSITIEGDVNGDLIVAGGIVNVKGEVEGNIFIVSGQVFVENMVGKSLYVAGGEVKISGDVARNVFVASGDVTLTGNVGEDLSVAAGKVFVEGKIGDDARIFAGQVNLRGDVADDVMISAGLTEISGDIGGTLVLSGGEHRVSSSLITGDLLKYGDGNFIISESTVIRGETIERMVTKAPVSNEWDFNVNLGSGLGLGLWLKTFYSVLQGIGLVVVGYILFKFAPLRVDSTIENLNGAGEYLKSSLVGFVAFPVGFFLGLMLLVSIAGWPVLKLLIVLFGLAMVLVTPLAGIWLGRAMMKVTGSTQKHVIPLTLGVMVIQIVGIIPVLGWIMHWFLTIAVVGAMMRMQWNKYKIAQNLHLKTAG